MTKTKALKPAPRATVKPDEHWGGFTVQAGYYGLVDDTRIGWVVEMPGSRAQARQIAALQPIIDRVVARHGGRARLSVKVLGGYVEITEYDFRRWTETVEVTA